MVLKSILSFIKHTSIYAIGNAINSVLAFFLIPLYLRNLTIEEYGIYGLLIIVMQIVSRFGNLGIEASMMRSFYDYETVNNQGRVLTTSLSMMLTVLLVIISISVFLDELINDLLFSDNNYSNLILYSIIIGALRALRKLPQSILRIKNKSVLYTTLEVINFVVGLSLLIFLLEIKNYGLKGLIVGTLCSMIFNTVVFYSFVIKYYRFGFIISEVTKQLKFGAPLLPAAVSSLMFVFSGRFFLEHYHSLELVGVFTLLFQLAAMLETFMGQPIKLAWQPYFLKHFKENDSKNIFKNIVKIVAIASISIAICMALFAEPLFSLFAKPDYLQAVKYLPIMLIFYSLWSIVSIYNGGVIATRKTTFIMVNFFIGAVISLMLSWFLIPEYKVLGAVIALCLSYLIMFINIQWFNYKLGFDYADWKSHWIVYLIGAFYLLISTLFYGNTGVLIFLMRLLVVISFPVTLYIFGILSNKQLNQVKRLLKNRAT